MLSEEELKLLADIFAQRYSEVSAGILQDMAETLGKTGDMIPAYAKKLQQMYTYGYDVDLITRQLARESGKSMEEIAQMYEAVAQEGMDWAKPFYAAKGIKQMPLEENQVLQSILRSAAVTTGNSLRNMSNTTVVGIGSGDAFQPLGTFYKNTVDRAILAVATGTEDYKRVIRQAVKEMGGSGLRVQYESGYTRRMDSAVRQNILDGVSYIAQETARATGEEFGADGVQITAHAPCAPDHLPYQGYQYSHKEFAKIQGDLARRIGEWNCGHTAYAILLGISPPAYSKAELEEMRRYSEEKIKIDGKEYTRYECTQLQRKLETSLRYAREEKKLYQTFGDADLTREATEKIRTLSNKYAEVSEKAGLPARAERIRIVSSRLKEKRVVSGGKDGIIKTGAKKTFGWQDRHAELMYEEVRKRTTDCKRISENTIFTEKAVREIKDHMFIKEHRFLDGRLERFDPDFDQVQAWDRLTKGTHTDVDIILLKHEYVELVQMKLHNLAYEDAHEIANKKHDWFKALFDSRKEA